LGRPVLPVVELIYTKFMAIQSLDQWLASNRQRVRICKTASRTVVATIPFSVFDLAGNPGSGTLAGSNTANGVCPTDTTAGFPDISFSSGTGYLTKVEFYSSVISRLMLFDMLFKAGAYSYAAGTTTLSSQPAISQRCPDYLGGASFGARNEIWIEVSTAFVTGTSWQVQITYTNQAGTAGRTSIISAAQNAAALTAGKMFQIALQSGDTGVQKIESVIVTNGGTAMTAGAFNVLILRSLWTMGRVPIANGGDIHDIFKTGAPIVYSDSALYLTVSADGTASGLPEIAFDICNG
jgi:hypothetical protein